MSRNVGKAASRVWSCSIRAGWPTSYCGSERGHRRTPACVGRGSEHKSVKTLRAALLRICRGISCRRWPRVHLPAVVSSPMHGEHGRVQAYAFARQALGRATHQLAQAGAHRGEDRLGSAIFGAGAIHLGLDE